MYILEKEKQNLSKIQEPDVINYPCEKIHYIVGADTLG